jgi:hypothetical protein
MGVWPVWDRYGSNGDFLWETSWKTLTWKIEKGCGITLRWILMRNWGRWKWFRIISNVQNCKPYCNCIAWSTVTYSILQIQTEMYVLGLTHFIRDKSTKHWSETRNASTCIMIPIFHSTRTRCFLWVICMKWTHMGEVESVGMLHLRNYWMDKIIFHIRATSYNTNLILCRKRTMWTASVA